jgi:hypothetical protein
LAGGYDDGMRPPNFYIRATAIAIAVCAVVYAVSSLADKLIRHGIDNRMGGRISRGIDAFTPDVKRRDSEVEELIRP